MKRFAILSIIVACILGTIGLFMLKSDNKQCAILSAQDVYNLFTTDEAEIKERFQHAHKIIDRAVATVLAIPDSERTFANTIQPLDQLDRAVEGICDPLYALTYVSPLKNIRDAAKVEYLQLMEYMQDHVSKNKAVYRAVKSYIDTQAAQEDLNAEERKLLEEMEKGFEREGLHLSDEKLNELKKLTNQLNKLIVEFQQNIAADTRTLSVTRDQLAGVPERFIESLKKDTNGKYLLGTDYPTRAAILSNCSVESTRRDYARLFNNRAFPVNDDVLQKIMLLRHEIAQLLGFDSYTSFDLDNQMAKNAETVRAFMSKLIEAAATKQKKEFVELTKDLPESVKLENGKLKSWDSEYLKEYYKKKYLNLDDDKLAEYFPVDHTVSALLDIYQQLLGLQFTEVPSPDLWNPDVTMLRVARKKDNALLGFLILDLYPRAGKYTHAAHVTIMAGKRFKDGSVCPSVSMVMANFPKPSNGRPALFKFNDVNTFFHEFGHAMHAILGKTEFASFEGTHVKRDFVETPSQMFEEWLKQENVLHKVSKHYKTGEPLPKDMIDKLVELDRFDAGSHILRQAALTMISLGLFEDNPEKNIHQYAEQIYEQLLPYMVHDPEQHFMSAFNHLTGYGSKYYGYLWSKVFALDLFKTIKEEGLMSPEAGERLVSTILGVGGSKDPDVLLKEYLGREPNQQAFMESYGLGDS